ncbi:MAG: hypothetical protein M1818_007441 [Claussenomyces sp. TS43310]|nr:MAG: hypothetical protein M1818_007441 [Claussenomyces sp. TS43310]
MTTKLPLTIRKNGTKIPSLFATHMASLRLDHVTEITNCLVRDEYESKVPDFEAQISAIMGEAWTVKIDVPAVWALAEDRYPKDRPGHACAEYITNFISNLKAFITRFGDDGKDELNTLVSQRQVTLTQDDTGKVVYSGCDIRAGQFRILFGTVYFGSNVHQATGNIAGAVQNAEQPAGAPAPALSFDARTAIKEQYNPAIDAVLAKARTLLALPDLAFTIDFEETFARLDGAAGASAAPRDWQKRLGAHALAYFAGFTEAIERQGFGKDDMLQEGFADAVDKKVVQVRVVDKLVRKTYNEMVIEDGVAYIQTTAVYWNSNVRDPANGLMDLL